MAQTDPPLGQMNYFQTRPKQPREKEERTSIAKQGPPRKETILRRVLFAVRKGGIGPGGWKNVSQWVHKGDVFR